MGIVTRLSLSTAKAHRGRYVLGIVAVTVASAFMVAGGMLIAALRTQLRVAGADDGGSASGLFVLLTAFGLIVVVAAAFVITNSFQTVLASRARELALLRAVGMRSDQAFTSVVVEGLLVGLLGALLGLAAGSAVAWSVISRAFPGVPLAAPGGGTVAVALVVGVGVTLAAVLPAARHATRIPAVAALNTAQTMSGQRIGRLRITAGVALLALGLGLTALPLDLGDLTVLAFTAGALIAFAGLALLSPAYVPALARAASLGTARGPQARLAVGSLARGRRRTANTAVAVMLGVTLCIGVNVVLNSAVAEAAAQGYDQSDTGGMFALAMGLTGLTVLVGLIGVLNTIVLSVRERSRELSLLRAVGMSSRELRRTITVEGTLIGLVGVGLGLGLGLSGSAVLLQRLAAAGTVLPFQPPWLLIAAVVAFSLAFVAGTTRLVGGRAATAAPALATTV